MMSTRVLLWCLLLCSVVTSLPIGEFYPHGPNIDSSLQKLEDSSIEVFLKTPIRFYGEYYSSIFVNDNGILSFLTALPDFLNVQFPLEYPIIAPLYTNVDIQNAGDVFYRETHSPDLLQKVSYNIQRLFPDLAKPFSATSLFIVTWLNVGYYKNGSDKLNTYQAAIASDGEESFVELLYKDGGIQWLQGTGSGSGLPDARAQVGLVSIDGRIYSIRGSGTDQIKNLDKLSNSEIPGLFTFRIGNLGPSGNVEQPQVFNEIDTEQFKTCARSSSVCHSQAQCIDSEDGFCCFCREGYYGNGKTCLKEGIPLRVNGKVLFNLNGVTFPNVDLQAYIVTTDSRSYIALSRVPGQLGTSLQLLILLPGVIGWLFAKPASGAKNGYMLTGGVFNHTMDMKFVNTNHVVKITQRYMGLDVFDQLRLEAEIHGSIPTLPNANLSMPDFTQQFTRISQGILRSQSTHSMKIENLGEEYKVAVDQSITYDEDCLPDSFATKLKTARTFINYEASEQILRFATTTKISKVSDNEDPCLEGQISCVPNSSCLTEDNGFKCVCNQGFQTVYAISSSDDYGCVDINECLDGTSTCHTNAICINQVGSFSCQCRPGFTGDGRICNDISEDPCEQNPALCNQPNSVCQIPGNISTCVCNYGFQKLFNGESFTCVDEDECRNPQICHEFADCENTEGSYKCTCRPGYHGDGHDCQWREEETCLVVACGKNAECIDDPYEGAKCVCQSGFVGDGNTCKPEPVRGCHNCARDAYCKDGNCICRPGFIGDGLYCTYSTSQKILKTCLGNECWCPPGFTLLDDQQYCLKNRDQEQPLPQVPTNDNCNNKCHYNARCTLSESTRSYHCDCNPGFEGDGYDCSELVNSCFEVDLCDPHASCKTNGLMGYCECDPGYEGNGSICTPISLENCSSDDDCGADAYCSYNEHERKNECVCRPGFIRDSGFCFRDECDCNINADCIQDDEGKSVCKCREGFEGDGVTCRAVDNVDVPIWRPQSCNEVDNCSPFAKCIVSATNSEYVCQCDLGYEGDGLVCHPVDNCHSNPNLCHKNADCVQTSYSDYQCECKQGFVGNGQKCRSSYTNVDEFLLVNQGMATLRIPYQPTRTDPGYPIQLKTDQIAIGLTIDCVESRAYWSDITSKGIVSSSYNGADKEPFITTDIGSPEGLAIDWKDRNIYWTDSTYDTVNVANLDTKERKVIISNGLVNPRGIAVHPLKKKIFWSDWNRSSPKLEVSHVDGSNRAVFVQGSAVKLPNSLAIDYDLDELCWADAGTKSIECIGITNYIKRTVVKNCSYPFGLAISSDKYYWTDWETQKVESAWKVTGARADPIDVPLGGAGKLYGITTVPRSCPFS